MINFLTFAAVFIALWRMRTAELDPAPRAARGPGLMREGLRYVRGRPDLQAILLAVFFVGTFGLNFQMTSALMATEVFQKDAGGYGLLGSIMAVGSLAGALLAARRQVVRMRLVIGAGIVFGLIEIAVGVMPNYVSFAVALVPLGLAALTFMTAANTMMQMSVAPHLRGRVMALYMTVFVGGTPLGAPIVGWIGEAYGARWTLVGGGCSACSASPQRVRSSCVERAPRSARRSGRGRGWRSRTPRSRTACSRPDRPSRPLGASDA